MALLHYSPTLSNPTSDDGLGLGLGPCANLLVGMPGALAVVDTRTYQLHESHTFQPLLQHSGPSPLSTALNQVVTARGYAPLPCASYAWVHTSH